MTRERSGSCKQNHTSPYLSWEYSQLLGTMGVLGIEKGRILDLGCGSGGFSFPLGERGFEVVGIDVSVGSIRAARRTRLGSRAVVDLVVCDAKYLPFVDGCFEATVCGAFLHHVRRSLESVLAEAHRVLSRGGRLFAFEPNAEDFRKRLAYHLRIRLLDQPQWEYARDEFPLYPKKVEQTLRKVGFANVSHEPVLFHSLKDFRSMPFFIRCAIGVSDRLSKGNFFILCCIKAD